MELIAREGALDVMPTVAHSAAGIVPGQLRLAAQLVPVALELGAETLLGPLFFAWSRAEDGDGRITVSLGRYP